MATSRKTSKDAKTTAPKTSMARKPAPGAPDTPATSTMHDEEGERHAGPSHEAIARRAYELWLQRGGEHGRHEDDWRRAEAELRQGR